MNEIQKYIQKHEKTMRAMDEEIENIFDGLDPALVVMTLIDKLGKAGNCYEMSKEEFLSKAMQDISISYDKYKVLFALERGDLQ